MRGRLPSWWSTLECRVSESGYTEVLLDGRWQWEHRAIAERLLGRRLTRFEVVHHKNRKRSDNRPRNLKPMLEWKHVRLHYRLQAAELARRRVGGW